jgi:hypothetical protein
LKLTQKVDVFAEKPTKKASGSSRPFQKKQEHELVEDFLKMMDTWHGHKEIWDDALDVQLLENELLVRTTHKPKLAWGPKGTKYFSPSSANSDARELFMKLSRFKRDEQPIQPHQGRWRRLGTSFGDMIQRDLMFIEKHFKKEIGEAPAFKPEFIKLADKQGKNERSFPMWEKFAQKIMWIDHKGHRIPILGQPDGILKHRSGKRVGLEIKSKQTSAAQTSQFSMKEVKEDHFKQCVNYSIMYGVDEFLVVYGNMSKKAWSMSDEDYAKTPDLRAFHIKVTEDDRTQLLNYYASVLDAIDTGYPPKLDLDKWTFNNFKTACAKSLAEAEYEEIKDQVLAIKASRLPDWKKKGYIEALEFIEEVRANGEKEGS